MNKSQILAEIDKIYNADDNAHVGAYHLLKLQTVILAELLELLTKNS